MSNVKHQPPPKKNEFDAVWDLVKQDIEERDSDGLRKYGTRLQPFNGRNVSKDLYQELLDAVVYGRQLIEERREMVTVLKAIYDSNAYMEVSDELWLRLEELLKNLG
jgi:hypothetical protein